MDVDVGFHVEFLTKEEAWTLFKKKVGNHVDSHDEPLRDIAWAICNKCRGLPVAINAIGGALKGKDMHAWKDALHKLKNSMLKDIVGINQKVYASLKWSYDQLASEDAKSCFLLCCLFAEDAEISIDDLVRYYMAWRTLNHYQMPVTLEQGFDRVCTVVDTLKSCCLLLDGESKHLVKMHDVVRDIAISIAKDEKSFLVKHGFKDWPEKVAYEHCSVISLRPDDVRKVPDKLVCPELHTLRLDCATNRSPLQIPDEFFIGTGNLMVLDLTRVIMSPLLPASLAKLAKLQMLCLNRCHLGDISILKDLKVHLEILSLRGSNIEVLPPEVGELTRLRLLDMSDCLQLGMIPKGVISKLFRLEELHMPMNFGKWEGTTNERKISNASLDELMSLTRLTTLNIWIPDAALLPEDLSFENLVRFEIIISKRFEYDPVRHFRHRVYTKPLTGILILENFHVANNLEFLLGKPKRSIPRNVLYPYLTDLSVRDCGMKYLFSPSCARELVGLQRLTIKHCGVMEGVIETEKDKDEDIPIIFSGLKLLNLKNLPNLISFYPEKGKTATSSGSSSDHAQTVLFNDKVML
ncbi:hypothetical protein Vadar_004142 [Vaccinium darrowii]|uniref:Uncharacterized protein n=1 Tax=Vaccinium darrowii TaxID=229202 RepID=A0ACB7YIV5_9ERIC|nr:hypothetical protein Vadar_004142 [Vaccinium darrowii]